MTWGPRRPRGRWPDRLLPAAWPGGCKRRETVVSSKSIRTFIGDENGGYTVWSLTWFMLYVALGGIAVDMSDAFRNQNILQSTADASALP